MSALGLPLDGLKGQNGSDPFPLSAPVVCLWSALVGRNCWISSLLNISFITGIPAVWAASVGSPWRSKGACSVQIPWSVCLLADERVSDVSTPSGALGLSTALGHGEEPTGTPEKRQHLICNHMVFALEALILLGSVVVMVVFGALAGHWLGENGSKSHFKSELVNSEATPVHGVPGRMDGMDGQQ